MKKKSEVPKTDSAPTQYQTIIDAYEEMRNKVVSNAPDEHRFNTTGLAIVMNKGVASWVETLTSFCSDASTPVQQHRHSNTSRTDLNTTKDLRDTVSIIADLALKVFQSGADHVSRSA